MKLVELKQRFQVGSRWRTEYLAPIRPVNRVAPERTVTKVQSNGCWFSPTPWSNREGFLDWPKKSNIIEEEDGAIVLTFDSGAPYVRYWEIVQ